MLVGGGQRALGCKVNLSRAATVAALVLIVAGCRAGEGQRRRALSGDPAEENCGFEVQPPGLNADPCTGGVVVVPTVTHTRTPGSLDVFEHEFALERSGVVCVQILNGSGEPGTAVRSARATLDGGEIFSSNLFGPGREAARKRLAVDAGEHLLRIELAGKPDTELSASVKFAAVPLIEDSAFGIVKLRAVPASFSPNGNGVFDTTELRATVDSGTDLAGNSGSGASFALVSAAFEIADATACEPTATINVARTSIVPGHPVEIGATWDGTDGSGDTVETGRYFFRARGTLVRSVGGHDVVVGNAESQVAVVDVIEDAPAGEQDEGVTIGIEPAPEEVPYRAPEIPTLREVAIDRLERAAPVIEVAFRGRLVSSLVASKPVEFTSGSGEAPFIVGSFEVLETWKDDGSVGATETVAAPLTADAPRFRNGDEFAVFAVRSESELVAVDADGSVLPFVTATQVEFLRERFNEPTLRSLTGTGGTP